MSAAIRCVTPPRNVMRQLPVPTAVLTDDEFLVEMTACLSGHNLGQLKVSTTTTLMDVRVPLIGATGGGVNEFEIHLLDANGEIFDKATSTPFANASPDDVFQVIKVQLEDMIYLDMDRKEKRERRGTYR
jgi:hypothetical protein